MVSATAHKTYIFLKDYLLPVFPSSVTSTITLQSPKLEIWPVSLILQPTPISIQLSKTVALCLNLRPTFQTILNHNSMIDRVLIIWVEAGKIF